MCRQAEGSREPILFAKKEREKSRWCVGRGWQKPEYLNKTKPKNPKSNLVKILFFTDSHEDYVADSLLHGLKRLFGSEVVDYPKKDILYKGDLTKKHGLWGRGFTLYTGLLENDEVDRYDIGQKLRDDYFDLTLISSIHRQDHFFRKHQSYLHKRNTLIIDGEDGTVPVWEIDRSLSMLKEYRYYKREQTNVVRRPFSRLVPLRPISISYPKEKIHIPSIKTKLFCSHIVDPEVAAHLKENVQHVFSAERDYYNDLQASYFGVTMKRGGWDCMRHYEMAGNGVLLCFRNLDRKPVGCAPHGLSEANTVIYDSADDLMKKTQELKPEYRELLQAESSRWIRNNTTLKSAERILGDYLKDR